MRRLGLFVSCTTSLLALGCPADTVDNDTDPFTSDGTTTGTPGTTTGPSITTGADSSGSDTAPPATDDGPATSDSSGSTGEPPDPVCGNEVVETDEDCDGTNLNGVSCTDQGFDGGDLACESDCRDFDTSGCWFFFCGNGTVQGDELCDSTEVGAETCITQGFEHGTLLCNANCDGYDTAECGNCGDGTINGSEDCEGALLGGNDCTDLLFDGGTLSCAADCSFDTSDCSICGDGLVNGSESCDGVELDGATCESLGLGGGTLGCQAGCTYDFSMCDIAGIPFGTDGFYSGFALNPGVLPCDDISATGTPTGLTDDSNQSVPIGFTFPLYGVDYTDANIQSNGTLRFGDMSYLSFGNNCLPTATNPSTNTLYVFWDDLNPSLGAGEVWYQTLGPVGSQRFVVQWNTANFGGDAADLMTMQAVLHEATGQIDVCYVDTINAANTANSGAEATAGIQQNSLAALQFSCNTPDLLDGTMLMYIPN